MRQGWKDRKFTNIARHVLDDWLPPVLRDNRLLMKLICYVFHGAYFDIDFKRHVLTMTKAEIAQAYERLGKDRGGVRYRATDMTEAEIDWILHHVKGEEILEVGCGQGVLLDRLPAACRVTATDFSAAAIADLSNRKPESARQVNAQVADAENLPFPDRSFDTVICAHTLEHVIDFDKAVSELLRVSRGQVLIVVPCQRYYRYTVDYHLHFFPEPEQLLIRIHHPEAVIEKITGDLCLKLPVH